MNPKTLERFTIAGPAGALEVALNVPDVSVTGEVEVSVNTTGATVALTGVTLPAGPYLRVAATDLVLAPPQDFLASPTRWMEWLSHYGGTATAGPKSSSREIRMSGVTSATTAGV